ncbi:AGE family epimerase/isomerase [Roseobacter sp.]|uniref:AGE family epimerase/isomerase n=1 Tax=Roseobacter sp. TaxID=1907202 RepID=UPI0029676952|nr:AGE family epimerase/isomerase [Roseobacter sp.]MDW3181175.1 AGE family epimerase/isomerase [Roseobacter sp.]
MTGSKALVAAQSWVRNQALPFWAEIGFDRSAHNFVERADMAGNPLLAAPRRTMVQGRQIYVYAHAYQLGWFAEGAEMALTAADSLIARHFEADGAPGWVFSTSGETGEVADATRDFYAHSFALYGLAWAYRIDPRPTYRSVALQTLDLLKQRFRRGDGGYCPTLGGPAGTMLQNPHMHLFEAMLAWAAADDTPVFLETAQEVRDLVMGKALQRPSGALIEYLDENWRPKPGIEGQIWEPGHHFEWAWLLHGHERLAPSVNADDAFDLLITKARQHGYDQDGFVISEVLEGGAAHKPTRRSWPQTEGIKAEIASFERGGGASCRQRADQLAAKLMDQFLGTPVAGGWIDHFSEAGQPLNDFMPASTLYHVFLAIAEANRVGWTGDTA